MELVKLLSLLDSTFNSPAKPRQTLCPSSEADSGVCTRADIVCSGTTTRLAEECGGNIPAVLLQDLAIHQGSLHLSYSMQPFILSSQRGA